MDDQHALPRPLAVAVVLLTVTAVVVGSILGYAASAHAADVTHPRVVSANPANSTPHVLDGRVLTVAQAGGRMFAGGRFARVANPRTPTVPVSQPMLFAFNPTTGQIDPSFRPRLDKQVETLTVTADGMLVAGGQFSTVNGTARKGLVKLNPTTGQTVAGFRGQTNGRVMDTQLANSRLLVGGSFTRVNGTARGQLASLDPTTGALTADVNLPLAGPRQGGALKVDKLDVSPDGRLLAVIGNFTTVAGQRRDQIAIITLTPSPARVNGWATSRYQPACSSAFPSYLHDIDLAVDSAHRLYAVVVTTGGPRGNLCDTAARFPVTVGTPGQRPAWVNPTGGDTLWSVAATGPAVYVGGHQRWMNNPHGHDTAGPGAVAREGIAALDPTTGRALAWNPGRARGVGAFVLYPTASGLWVGSDTTRIGGETHRRLALLPL